MIEPENQKLICLVPLNNYPLMIWWLSSLTGFGPNYIAQDNRGPRGRKWSQPLVRWMAVDEKARNVIGVRCFQVCKWPTVSILNAKDSWWYAYLFSSWDSGQIIGVNYYLLSFEVGGLANLCCNYLPILCISLDLYILKDKKLIKLHTWALKAILQ